MRKNNEKCLTKVKVFLWYWMCFILRVKGRKSTLRFIAVITRILFNAMERLFNHGMINIF